MQAYMTQPRKRLLTYLHGHADETLSAGQIAQDLPEISVSAVYRNLSALEKDGAVQKVAKAGSREVFYRYKKAEECRAHLHLSCKPSTWTRPKPKPWWRPSPSWTASRSTGAKRSSTVSAKAARKRNNHPP